MIGTMGVWARALS